MTTPKPSPSVRGVRPTPRELAHQFARSIGMQNDVNFKDLLTAAITRDREQGRAEMRLAFDDLYEARRCLQDVGGAWTPAGDDAVTIHRVTMERARGVADRLLAREAERRRALAAPLAPATTGKEPTT